MKDTSLRKLLKHIGPKSAAADHRAQLIAAMGALIGIGLIIVLDAIAAGGFAASVPLIAPIGASAVIVFSLPQSPLGQPWNVVVGNFCSACVGVACAKFVAQPELAAVLAMFGAVVVMALTRSLHPPGGAVALTAIVSGASIKQLGFSFVVSPVLVSSVALIVFALVYHRATRRFLLPRETN